MAPLGQPPDRADTGGHGARTVLHNDRSGAASARATRPASSR